MRRQSGDPGLECASRTVAPVAATQAKQRSTSNWPILLIRTQSPPAVQPIPDLEILYNWYFELGWGATLGYQLSENVEFCLKNS
jgi:hypothetical protein